MTENIFAAYSPNRPDCFQGTCFSGKQILKISIRYHVLQRGRLHVGSSFRGFVESLVRTSPVESLVRTSPLLRKRL